MELLNVKSKTTSNLKKKSIRYQNRGNKIEPKTLETIDYISFIQERVDFSGFTTDYNLNSSSTKITKKKIKLTNFFCICFSVIILILVSLITMIIILTNNSDLKESNSVTFISRSTLIKKTSSTSSSIINSINIISSSTSSSKTKILIIKTTPDLQTLPNWSTKKIDETSKINFSKSTVNLSASSTTSKFSSKVLSSTSINKITTKTLNIENILNLNLSTLNSQNCPDGFTGSYCLDGKNLQLFILGNIFN